MSKTSKTYPAPGKAPEIFYQAEHCPLRNVLGQLGRKWPSLILCHLSFGSHRFSELRGAIPDISQRMLSQSLKELERDGLITRETQNTVPPRVDYTLTPLGESYSPHTPKDFEFVFAILRLRGVCYSHRLVCVSTQSMSPKFQKLMR